jgi:hypothetical protein
VITGDKEKLGSAKGRCSEITWIVYLKPSRISHDCQIKQWKDRVITSTGITPGELKNLRVVISHSLEVPECRSPEINKDRPYQNLIKS